MIWQLSIYREEISKLSKLTKGVKGATSIIKYSKVSEIKDGVGLDESFWDLSQKGLDVKLFVEKLKGKISKIVVRGEYLNDEFLGMVGDRYGDLEHFEVVYDSRLNDYSKSLIKWGWSGKAICVRLEKCSHLKYLDVV